MATKDKKAREKFFHRLKHTYRLVFYNDKTFEEKWHLRITVINLLSIAGTAFILLVGGSMAMMMFTPLRTLIPGYPTNAMRRQIVTNAIRLDSLEYELQLRDNYFNALNALVMGREPEMLNTTPDRNPGVSYENITFTRSEQDSLLRRQVEEEEQFNFVLESQQPSEEASISKMHFFKPVEGVVTNEFNMGSDHFGIDIVASANEVIKSVLDGTVIMAAWTVDTGYVLQIQHAANIISVYKHNANLLKKAGDTVRAGDAIAIVGNSGELTTGPHLHFEIWQAGKPVNPQEYIVF